MSTDRPPSVRRASDRVPRSMASLSFYLEAPSYLFIIPTGLLLLIAAGVGTTALVTDFWSYEVWHLYFKVHRLYNGLWTRCNLRYPIKPPGTFVVKCINRFLDERLENLEFRQIITYDPIVHDVSWEMAVMALIIFSVMCCLAVVLFLCFTRNGSQLSYRIASVACALGFLCCATSTLLYRYHFYNHHVVDPTTGFVDRNARKSKLGWSFWLAVASAGFQFIAVVFLTLLSCRRPLASDYLYEQRCKESLALAEYPT